MTQPTTMRPQGLTPLGRFVILLLVAGSLYGAYRLFVGNRGTPGTGASTDAAGPGTGSSPAGASRSPAPTGEAVEIGIAYGTEKERWLRSAAEEFAKTNDGQRVKVNLIPMGSLEGAQALLAGDTRIHVWAPASSVYEDKFVQEWTVNHPRGPILKKETLALTPMVFVVWQERYDAFVTKYPTMDFRSLGDALRQPGGWASIANKPEWGLFKFGHTHPNQSNSGLVTLILLAYDYHDKSRDLAMSNILDLKFQQFLQGLERGVSGLSASTGTMMKDMVLKGPGSYDAVFVYESVAIDFLKNAEGRWGSLRVVYPKYNLWNDNPYCVIDAEWSSPAQRAAADTFLRYLMSEPVQRQSLAHGFRPGNPEVPVRFPESPFTAYEKYGLRMDLPGTVCQTPGGDVIHNLLAGWERTQGRR